MMITLHRCVRARSRWLLIRQSIHHNLWSQCVYVEPSTHPSSPADACMHIQRYLGVVLLHQVRRPPDELERFPRDVLHAQALSRVMLSGKSVSQRCGLMDGWMDALDPTAKASQRQTVTYLHVEDGDGLGLLARVQAAEEELGRVDVVPILWIVGVGCVGVCAGGACEGGQVTGRKTAHMGLHPSPFVSHDHRPPTRKNATQRTTRASRCPPAAPWPGPSARCARSRPGSRPCRSCSRSGAAPVDAWAGMLW